MIRHHRDVLPNGLRVVTVEAPHLHSAMVAVYVRVGSRHETVATSGVSHFLEHLFFRGSHRYRDTVRMNAHVEGVGGNLNAVTTRDSSSFYTPVHARGVGTALEVLGDLLTRPLLGHLEVEKRIILEEMLDEVDERGRDIDLDNLSKRALFEDHPLALKIAGTPDSVRRLSLAGIREHFHRYYVAGNMVVCVAGPVRRRDVVRTAARAFRRVPAGQVPLEAPPPPPPPGPRLRHVFLGEPQTSFRLSFVGPPEHHRDTNALALLRRVLDDGLSSRLPFNVIERRGLAYSLGAALETFHDVGLFEVDGACAPEAMGAVYREVCRTLGSLAAGDLDAAEVRRAKARTAMHFSFLEDSPADLAGWFGGNALFRQPTSFRARLEATRALTRADLIRAARTWLRRDRAHLTTVGPNQGLRALRRTVRRSPGLWAGPLSGP